MKLSLKNALLISLCMFAVASFISIAAANVFLGISVLLFLIITYKNKGVNIATDKLPYFKAIAVFAGALFVSALFSSDIAYGLKTWADFFIWRFIPFVMLLTVLDGETFGKKVLAAVIGGFAIDCLYAICWSVFIFKGKFDWIRAAGFVGHPMTLAGWTCILLPVLLVFIFRKDVAQKYHWLAILLFAIGSVALLFNATRGAWLALAVVLPLMSSFFILQNKKLLLISLALVLGVGTILVNNASFMKRVDSIDDLKNTSNRSRLIIWDTSIEMFKEHPVLGVGLGNYKNVYQNEYIAPRVDKEINAIKKLRSFRTLKKSEQAVVLKAPVNLWKIQGYKKLKKQERNEFNKAYSKFRFEYSLSKLNHAHNNLLQMLAENGLVGFIGYICAFGFILWKNFKNFLLNKNPYALMIVGSTSALLLQGLTEYNFGNSSVMKIYWLVLACLIILASKYNDGMKNE